MPPQSRLAGHGHGVSLAGTGHFLNEIALNVKRQPALHRFRAAVRELHDRFHAERTAFRSRCEQRQQAVPGGLSEQIAVELFKPLLSSTQERLGQLDCANWSFVTRFYLYLRPVRCVIGQRFRMLILSACDLLAVPPDQLLRLHGQPLRGLVAVAKR